MQHITSSDNTFHFYSRSKNPVIQPELDERVPTVATSQGLDTWLIIYAAGLVPRYHVPLGPNSILENVCDLYVVTSRAELHLVFVSGHELM